MPENPPPPPLRATKPLHSMWTSVIRVAASHLDDETKKAEILDLLEVE